MVVVIQTKNADDPPTWDSVTYSRAKRCALFRYRGVKTAAIIPKSKFFLGITNQEITLYNIPDQKTAKLFSNPWGPMLGNSDDGLTVARTP